MHDSSFDQAALRSAEIDADLAVHPDRVVLGALPADHVGDLLTLQRAAYVTEAQLYEDARLPALTQTMDELVTELATSACTAAWLGPRLVGAVRTREVDGVLHIGRLVVAPDLQGRGIGSRLLVATEEATSCRTATLFTGHRSTANLRLCTRRAYRETHRESLTEVVTLVHLSKALTEC